MTNTPNDDLLWKQYELEIDLYKFYLEIAVKFNVFYYAATGAILSFYFTRTDVALLRYSLLFPILMSVGFAGLYLYGAWLLRILRQDIFDIRDKLGLETAPDTIVLSVALSVSAVLMFFIAAVLAWLFFTK